MGKEYDLEEKRQLDGAKIPRLFPSSRGALSLVGFFGGIILYLIRINMSIAIVCMTIDNETVTDTNETYSYAHESRVKKWSQSHMWVYDKKAWNQRSADIYTDASELCPGEAQDDEGYEETGDFYWDRDLRGLVNSSFFWGYVLTQVIGGIIAIRFGAKWVLGGGLIISIVFTFLSPPAANISPYALMGARFLNGMGSGVFYPCWHHLWAQWAPPKETSRLYTFQSAGSSWGALLSFALSGVICQQLGWEWVFWMYGIWGAIYIVFWAFFGYNTPATHPRIDPEERKYIERAIGDTNAKDEPISKMPWCKILFAPEMVAMYVAQFCTAWGAYTNLTSLPQYMEDVLKFNITTNGLASSLPHLVKWIFCLIFAWVADYLITRGIFTIGTTRKIIQSVAMLPAAFFSIIVGYFDCYSTGWVMFCLICAEAFTAGSSAGLCCSGLDMAPRYAGITMGIGNTIGNIAGILAPIAVANITSEGTLQQWRSVFFLSALMYLIAWLGYIIFIKGEVLPWAMLPEDIEKDIEVEEIEVGIETAKEKSANGDSKEDTTEHGNVNGHVYSNPTFTKF